MMGVSGSWVWRRVASAARVSYDLTVRITTSPGSEAGGAVSAGTGTVVTERSVSMIFSPSAATRSTWRGRPTRTTRSPAAASRPPSRLPTPPAPTMM
jgi:hypothetical protein